eukprot:m.34710 g.34710  ORF g.34710 m.34710 type:complete len:306 (+) comp9800_c0_seq1:156-1073(+)
MASVSKTANQRRIAFVESCFGSHGVPLQSEGRTLLGEGLMNKVCRKALKPRMFFLFNDMLVYGTVVKEKEKYSKQVVIPVDEVRVVSLSDTTRIKNAFCVVSFQKSFTVQASTPKEKAEWIRHLALVTKKPPASRVSDVLPDGFAPNWVADEGASVCMHCNATKFTFLNRKHHCRKCGIVVCGPCSTHQLLLPKQAPKPLRVCDQCYEEDLKLGHQEATYYSARTSTTSSSGQPTHTAQSAAQAVEAEQRPIASDADDVSDTEDEVDLIRQPSQYPDQALVEAAQTSLEQLQLNQPTNFFADHVS